MQESGERVSRPDGCRLIFLVRSAPLRKACGAKEESFEFQLAVPLRSPRLARDAQLALHAKSWDLTLVSWTEAREE